MDFTNYKKMNYAQVLKGHSTRGGAQRCVDSQSELELGRHLSDSEKYYLFRKFPPSSVSSVIEKVAMIMFLFQSNTEFLVWIWCTEVPSSAFEEV